MRHRIFLRGFSGNVIRDPQTIHHLVKVLRLRKGDIFIGYDGEHEKVLRVREAKGDVVMVDCIEEKKLATASDVHLTVAQALLKGKRWDIFIEKMVELGVERIAPLSTCNTVVKIGEGEVGKKSERWKKMAEAAAAQCGAGKVPEICEPMPFSRFLSEPRGNKGRWILTVGADCVGLREALSGGVKGEVVIAIGPEGDFTAEEIEKAKGAGFVPVSLGNRILRAETAAIVAAALILYEGNAFSHKA